MLVGALLCEPDDPACAAGVIFFNNVGYLGMCGHGTIGAGRHAGPPGPDRRRARTGSKRRSASSTSSYDGGDRVTVENVPSYRHAAGRDASRSPGYGPVTGDVAWGGNWFFLVGDHGETLDARRTSSG